MKKILSYTLLIMFAVMFNCTMSYGAISKQINANIKTKRVPAGTVLNLKLLDPISSSIGSVGDQFDLMIADNVVVNNAIVIPQGTVIRGSLDEVQAPKMLYKGGVIRLYFDHIVSPTGRQLPFYAGICNNKYVTYDGALSSNTNYGTAFNKTVQNTKNIVVKPTTWAWDKGGEMLNGSPKYVLAPIAAFVSVPVAGFYFVGDSIVDIFKKGEDIYVNQGDIIQVQLLKPIDMPVY